MTATVRSVRVVMNAEVGKYIADMKLAGRETKAAFDGSSKSVKQASRDFDGLASNAKKAGQEVEDVGPKARRTEREIDRMSGRVRLLGEAVLTIGPALIPITAGIIPALTGMGAAAGAAAGGVGVIVLAFAGVGKALKAVNDYQLEPTAAHLQAMREEMGSLGQDGRQFVRFLDGLGSDLRGLQLIARDNMFPGVEAGITSLLKDLPQARQLVADLSAEVGKLAAEAGAALSGDAWSGFINYVGTDSVPTLDALGHTLGNVALGLANLMVAFAPATRDFTAGMEHASEAFAHWSANVGDTQGFQNFLTYVRTEGPQVVALLEALGNMLLGVAHAAAPIGNAVLPALTDIANIIGVIGQSPLGPVLYGTATAMVVVARATSLASTAMGRLSASSATAQGSLLGVSKATVGVVAAFAAATAIGNKLGEQQGTKFKDSNIGQMLDAISTGGGHKEINQLATDFDNVHASLTSLGGVTAGKWLEPIHEAMTGFGTFGNTPLDNAADNLNKVDQALAALVASGNAEKAKEIFDTIVQGISGGSVPGGSVAPDLMKRINSQFSAYTSAVSAAKTATDPLTGSISAAGGASKQTAAQIDGLVAAMHDQRSAALAAFDAQTAYRQALKDAAAQAKKSNAGIRGSSDAALANRAALSGLAAAWNNQSDAVKNNVKRSRDARRAFIDMATGMGVPIGQAKRLARAVLDIPRSHVTKTSVDAGNSFGVISAVQARMNALQDRTLHITTFANKITAGSAGTHLGGRADGGLISGPGTGTSDDVPIRASNGEFVVRAAAVGKYGVHMMDAINQERFASGGMVGGYAGGGTVRNPNSQLYGLGTKRWSDAELGGRISNLTVKQINGIGRAMDDLSNKQLKHLGKALDKATSLQEKQTEAAKTAFDDVKQRRAGYASNYSQALTRDIWGGGGNTSAFSGGFAANSILGATQQLNMQTQDAKDMERLEKILRERGVHDGALDQILSGGIDRVRSAASESPAALRAYESAYDTAQRYTASAANTGAALLTPEFGKLQAEAAKQTHELQAIHADQHLLVVEQRQRHKQNQAAARARNNGARPARRGGTR